MKNITIRIKNIPKKIWKETKIHSFQEIFSHYQYENIHAVYMFPKNQTRIAYNFDKFN